MEPFQSLGFRAQFLFVYLTNENILFRPHFMLGFKDMKNLIIIS